MLDGHPADVRRMLAQFSSTTFAGSKNWPRRAPTQRTSLSMRISSSSSSSVCLCVRAQNATAQVVELAWQAASATIATAVVWLTLLQNRISRIQLWDVFLSRKLRLRRLPTPLCSNDTHYPRRLYSRRRGAGRSVVSVCLSVCPRSKRKTAWAVSTKVGRHTVHGRTVHSLPLNNPVTLSFHFLTPG